LMMMASTGLHAKKSTNGMAQPVDSSSTFPNVVRGAHVQATKLRLELRRALELSGERAERLLQAEADAEACLRLVLALKQREAELEQDAASRAQLYAAARMRITEVEHAEDER
jgi:hypothetical protein